MFLPKKDDKGMVKKTNEQHLVDDDKRRYRTKDF